MQVCHEFVFLSLVYRPSSESQLTMSTEDAEQGTVMSILFIAEIHRTFLRGDQPAKPFPNAIRKRSIATITIKTRISTDDSKGSPFFFTDGLSRPTHSFRYHSKVQFLPYRIHHGLQGPNALRFTSVIFAGDPIESIFVHIFF